MILKGNFFLLALLCVGLCSNLYSGKNTRPSKNIARTPNQPRTVTRKYIPGKDVDRKIRDARMGHTRENITCKQISASLACAALLGLLFSRFNSDDPNRPLEQIVNPAIGVLFGFFIAFVALRQKPIKVNH